MHVDAVHRAAVVLTDDDVLRHVHQTAGQVARIGRFQSRVGQTFAGAVRRDEVLQYGQSLAEVSRNRRLDNFPRGLSHQSAHPGKLTNLLLRSASAGVRHDVDRVNVAFLVLRLHYAEHFVGYFFRNGRPDFDYLVVTLAISDSPVQILLLDIHHLLLGVAYQGLLVFRDDHVIDANRETSGGRITEA